MTWPRTLWNTWAVWRQWGPIGQEASGSRIDECMAKEEALWRAAESIERRMRRKYAIKSSSS